jgi:hypothetical protein
VGEGAQLQLAAGLETDPAPAGQRLFSPDHCVEDLELDLARGVLDRDGEPLRLHAHAPFVVRQEAALGGVAVYVVDGEGRCGSRHSGAG